MGREGRCPWHEKGCGERGSLVPLTSAPEGAQTALPGASAREISELRDFMHNDILHHATPGPKEGREIGGAPLMQQQAALSGVRERLV